MRKLMALAIVLSLAGVSRSWALAGLGDLEFDGSLEVSGVSANNESDRNSDVSDRRGTTLTRVRLGMDAPITDGVSGRVEIDRTPSSAGTGAAYGGTGTNGTNITAEEAAWQINNALVTLENIWTLKATLGRQYVGDSGDLVWHIGVKSDDALSINSIQGLGLSRAWMDEKLGVNLFTGKAVSAADANSINAAGDTNLSNLSASLKDVVPTAVVSLGYLWGTQKGATLATKRRLNIGRVGAKGGLMEDMVTYHAEYLWNMNEDGEGNAAATPKHKGNALDLAAGLNLKENKVGKFSFAAEYLMASGDKDNTDSSDKEFQDFSYLGVNTSDRYFGEIYGKSNLLGGGVTPFGNGAHGIDNRGLNMLNIGVKLIPSLADGKYAVKLDYYKFDRNVKASGEKSDIGSELDLVGSYAHSANVSVDAGYAMLAPGDALTGGGANPDDNITKLFAKLNVKWGGEEK